MLLSKDFDIIRFKTLRVKRILSFNLCVYFVQILNINMKDVYLNKFINLKPLISSEFVIVLVYLGILIESKINGKLDSFKFILNTIVPWKIRSSSRG